MIGISKRELLSLNANKIKVDELPFIEPIYKKLTVNLSIVGAEHRSWPESDDDEILNFNRQRKKNWEEKHKIWP